ncbi:MAG: hypothetical protein J6B87_03900 [Clostridia bacterium]|nr:hypothetical protein [Clostridia bacterium]
MTGFLSKLKDAFSKELVFFFCVAIPYLILLILFVVFNCHIGLVISNILYWALFITHRILQKDNLQKQYKTFYSSEFDS